MTELISILKLEGPMVSSELSRKLSKMLKISTNTASQKVARNIHIKKIQGFFKSNQSFCYLSSQENEDIFLENFIKSLYNYGRKYWFCLNALKLHGGIIHKNYLQCYTYYPILPLENQFSFDSIIKKFITEKIILEQNDYYLLSPKFKKGSVNNINLNTLEIIKHSILTSFDSLVKNIGLISYETGTMFGEHSKFRWAFKAVTPLEGMKKNGNFGFLVADILIGTPIYERDVYFFVEKVRHIQSLENSSKILPVFIVDDMDKDAMLYLKKNGIIIGFIGELFGQKYAELLKELITILKNAGASLKKNPNKYLDLIIELKKYNEGIINNIRGTLFEFVIGHIHSYESNNSITIGKEIWEDGSKHEMDVLANYSDKIIVAECKAQKSLVNVELVNKWLDIKIPVFRRWIKTHDSWHNKSIEFELWSTSGYSQDALEKLSRISHTAVKSKISFFTPKDIRERAKQMKNKKLKDALDEFFLVPNV